MVQAPGEEEGSTGLRFGRQSATSRGAAQGARQKVGASHCLGTGLLSQAPCRICVRPLAGLAATCRRTLSGNILVRAQRPAACNLCGASGGGMGAE